MRAWTLHRPGHVADRPLTLEERRRPEPGPGEVRLRVLACGICRTDLHIVAGELPPPRLPVVPGHQVVATVEALGSGAQESLPDGIQTGSRVGVAWLHRACGRCAYCLGGRENLCERPRFTGYHADGGYSEWMVAPADALLPIPARYSDVEAAPLLCAGVIGYRSLKVAGVQPGQRLALIGFGASAHLVLQVAVAWGCEVIVFSRGPHHRQLARRLGAVWTGAPGETPPFAADAAISFAPAGGVVPAALQVLRRGGTLAINAVHLEGGLPPLDYALLYHERRLASVANTTRADGREFMALAARLPLRVHAEAVPFTQANEALLRLQAGETEAALVLTMDRHA
ncbi:zinc-dependent alcohol dehydrogenase family protein [Geochorda subterranea]|uniref:alcohol dehydrogenase n=1 Tax=Geochorda subterranea TaxID=3109564 RepID=A0ABZ1BNG7_9FIRM|nr:zinc-dependent alcohol dehydrogenase family protein [Limnochorda sp. LNt]WRP14379.1 zinc-dependent alcohol dehydrogenase family protein [Limnochorda sp. LNt]